MRASVRVAIPLNATSSQLRATANLLAIIERGQWGSAAETFDRMHCDGAQLAEPIEIMLGRLAGQLRIAARERATEEEEAARLAEAARAPVPQ